MQRAVASLGVRSWTPGGAQERPRLDPGVGSSSPPAWAQGEEEAAGNSAKGLLTEKGLADESPQSRGKERASREGLRGGHGGLGGGAGGSEEARGPPDTQGSLAPRAGPRPGVRGSSLEEADAPSLLLSIPLPPRLPGSPIRMLFCSRGVSVMIRRYLTQR